MGMTAADVRATLQARNGKPASQRKRPQAWVESKEHRKAIAAIIGGEDGIGKPGMTLRQRAQALRKGIEELKVSPAKRKAMLAAVRAEVIAYASNCEGTDAEAFAD